VLFPINEFRKVKFEINREEKHGGDLEYYTFNDLKNDFENKKTTSSRFKNWYFKLVN